MISAAPVPSNGCMVSDLTAADSVVIVSCSCFVASDSKVVNVVGDETNVFFWLVTVTFDIALVDNTGEVTTKVLEVGEVLSYFFVSGGDGVVSI